MCLFHVCIISSDIFSLSSGICNSTTHSLTHNHRDTHSIQEIANHHLIARYIWPKSPASVYETLLSLAIYSAECLASTCSVIVLQIHEQLNRVAFESSKYS